jgi:hypothetical protein
MGGMDPASNDVFDRAPDCEDIRIMRNPFLRFQRTAEAAGYPALLIVSALCLLMVVAAVALLALTPGTFALAFAVLNLAAAVAIVFGAIFASIADVEHPETQEATVRPARPQATAVVPLDPGRASAEPRRADRRAA